MMDEFDPNKFIFPSDASGQPSEPVRPVAPQKLAPGASPTPKADSFQPEKFEFPTEAANKPDYKSMPWNQVLAKGASGFVPSAWKTAKETVQSFYPENLPDTAMGLGNLASGVASKAMGAVGVKQDPREKANTEAALNALMHHYADKYSTEEGLKRAIVENPGDVAGDFASIMTMSPTKALMGLPGAGGKIARTINTVGEYATPVTGPIKAVGAAAGSVSPLVNAGLSKLSGVSFRSLQEAAKAGITSDPSFWRAMSGEVPAHELVNDINGAIKQIADERAEKYRRGMSSLSTTRTLPFQPIENALNHIESMAYAGPLKAVKNSVAADAHQKMVAKINEWKALAARDSHYQTVHGFDELKQALNGIADSYSEKPEYASLSKIGGAVKREIQKIDPQYAEIMDSYQGMTKDINELNKELLARKGSAGSTIRKVFRAQTDKHKQALLDDLAKRDPSLPAKIAGLEVAHAHGHVGENAGFGALLNLIFNEHRAVGPAAAAAAAAAGSSPQVAARVAAGVKQGMFVPELAGKAAGALSPIVGGAHLMDDVERNPRPGRATGGRTGPKAQTAQSLISAVERAKKAVQQQTESILSQPDEHVVAALSVANKHI